MMRDQAYETQLIRLLNLLKKTSPSLVHQLTPFMSEEEFIDEAIEELKQDVRQFSLQKVLMPGVSLKPRIEHQNPAIREISKLHRSILEKV